MQSWQNFYVIVGSAAAALVGIQFVVITLLGNRPEPAREDAVNAFGTPTVVHLSTALLVSAIMTAPWSSRSNAAWALAVSSVIGLAYSGLATIRAHRQTEYEPVWEDWLWYSILPCADYLALGAAAISLRSRSGALFYVAGAVLGIVFIAIHNAWDTVLHLVTTQPNGTQK